MAMTPSPATALTARDGPYYLSAFDKGMASLVASWTRDEGELLWLAPKTPPPLTAAKVMAWPGPGGCPLLLYRDGAPEPLGYLELNPMASEGRHFWMGHFVLDPDHRGQGLGVLMVGLMLDEGFRNRRIERISLVVFPENLSAVRCYRWAGFLDAGEQVRYFPTTGRRCRLLRMTIDRQGYDLIRAESA